MAYALKSLELPEGFWESIFESQVKEGVTGSVVRLCIILVS